MRNHPTAFKRFLSLLTAVWMLVGALPFSAVAEDQWESLSIFLSWQGANGNPMSVPAGYIQDSGNAFWAQVDPSALPDGLTLSISHPDGYVFNPPDGSPLAGIPDSGSAMDLLNALPIQVTDQAGNYVADLLLYISSQPLPTPEPVSITVRNVGSDGADLGSRRESFYPGVYTIAAEPQIGDYTNPSPASAEVEVYQDGTASQSEILFTYDAPAAPVTASVQVTYTLDGEVIGQETLAFTQGEDNRLTPNPGFVPAGAELAGAEAYTVTVLGQDQADPSRVSFDYLTPAAAPVTASVQVTYTLDGEVIGQETVAFTQGEDNRLTPNPGFVPAGAELAGAQAYTVTVLGQDQADPSRVSFDYLTPVAAPVTASVQVTYTLDGEVFARDTILCVEEEENRITPKAEFIPAGAEPDGPQAYDVKVLGQDQADPSQVTFAYKTPEILPVTATVTVLYTLDGGEISRESLTVTQGKDTAVTPNPALVPENASLTGPGEFSLQITGQDQVTPNQVTFAYETVQQGPVTAQVTVLYTLDGAEVDRKTATATQGQPNLIVPASDKLPADAVLTGAGQVEITVLAQDQAEPSQVVFAYTSPEAPATHTPAPTLQKDIAVYYQNYGNQDVATSQTVTLSTLGVHEIKASPTDLQSGYELDGEGVAYVELYENGASDVESVTFRYKEASAPTQAPVTEAPATQAPSTHPPQEDIKPGDPVNRWAVTNAGSLYYRKTPGGQSLGQIAKSGTYVWIYELVEHTDKGTADLWAHVRVKDTEAYIKFQFLDLLNQQHSDEYMAQTGATPAPPIGGASPAQTPVADASVTVYQVDGRGNPLAEPYSKACPAGMGTVITAQRFEGYTLQGEANITVNVDAQGVPERESVTFTYVQNAEPTAEATQTPQPTPEATAPPTPAPYRGYALTNQRVALRFEVSQSDSTILSTLEANTLVLVESQTYDEGKAVWSYVRPQAGGQPGYVPDSYLTHITESEAQAIIAANATPTPSPTPEITATPTPASQSGYAITLGDGVPMRSQAMAVSQVKYTLARDTVVFVAGQAYYEGEIWHQVQYNMEVGYIRADQLRWLSREETLEYLNNQKVTPQPTISTTPEPYNPNNPSSYGYTTKSVNFRSSPGVSSNNRIRSLNSNTFALVYGAQIVDGKTWYHVSVAGTNGYIMGDYFKVMSIAELEEYLKNPENNQGNASTGGSGSGNNSGGSSTGGSGSISSIEDANVGVWKNPSAGLQASYEPFDPFATPEPLATGTPTPEPSLTPTLEPLETIAPVDFPTQDTQTDNPSPVGWILGICGVLVLGGGGAYAYSLYRSNQRKAAARAAQRRQSAQRQPFSGATGSAGASGARPYARTANAPLVPPLAGSQSRQPGAAGQAGSYARPTGPSGQQPPRPGAAGQAPYTRPTGMSEQRPYTRPNGAAGQPPYNRPNGPAAQPHAAPARDAAAYARPTGGAPAAGQPPRVQPAASDRPVETDWRSGQADAGRLQPPFSPTQTPENVDFPSRSPRPPRQTRTARRMAQQEDNEGDRLNDSL